jgi:hypothetical protein
MTLIGIRKKDLQTLIHKNPLIDLILSQLSPFHVLTPFCVTIHLNATFSHMPRSHSFTLSTKIGIHLP